MERLINRLRHITSETLCLFCSMFFMLSVQNVTAEKPQIMQWSAADMLPFGNDISILRYGAYGSGAYPQRINLPGSCVRVRIDGVPLPSLSPFGPDLELIPSAFIDSVDCTDGSAINIYTRTMDSEIPETETNFLLGQRRRFGLQAVMERPMSPSSFIIFGGSSNGTHSDKFSETNSYRSYFTKYQRMLESGGSLFFTAIALRDRDGLRDLSAQDHMGERETDLITITTGIKSYRLTSRTTISPIVYYRSGISRIDRYNLEKSLDDDAAGFSVISSTQRGNTSFDVSLTSDSRFIDSRLHENSWTYNDTRLTGTWKWMGNRFRYIAGGGIIRSSEYGTGGQGESELAFKLTPSTEYSVHGTLSEEAPGGGYEIYPSLVFSDTTLVSDLDLYRFIEIESGFTMKRILLTYGISGFNTIGKQPAYNPGTSSVNISDKETFSGVKLTVSTNEKEKYRSDFTMRYINSSHMENIWPVPRLEIISQTKLTKEFVHNKLHATVLCNAHVSSWNNGPTSPDGTSLYLDSGIAIKVLSLSLFYMVENITGENTEWFDVLQWQGRNAMWGVRWKLEN
ncbi:MAG: hypothetical protein JXB48_18575 [Candidatus Latescibacteria bacterium]|nr:hypothetical protein [Candidatus Latescibacterota bacterium]